MVRLHTIIEKRAPLLAIAPGIIIYFVFLILPALGNIVFSLTNFDGNVNSFDYIGLENYNKVLLRDGKRVFGFLNNTLKFAFGVVVLQNIIGLSLALLTNRGGKFFGYARLIIFSPVLFGVIVVGFAWRLLLEPSRGPVNSVLALINAQSALLGEPKIALLLVILVHVWMYMGYAMIIYIAGLRSIGRELYDAAQIDGSSPTQTLLHITIPLLQPSLFINILLSLIGALNTFDIIVVLTNGGPVTTTTTLPFFIFKIVAGGSTMVARYGTMGYAASVGVIHFIIVSAIVATALFIFSRIETDITL